MATDHCSHEGFHSSSSSGRNMPVTVLYKAVLWFHLHMRNAQWWSIVSCELLMWGLGLLMPSNGVLGQLPSVHTTECRNLFWHWSGGIVIIFRSARVQRTILAKVTEMKEILWVCCLWLPMNEKCIWATESECWQCRVVCFGPGIGLPDIHELKSRNCTRKELTSWHAYSTRMTFIQHISLLQTFVSTCNAMGSFKYSASVRLWRLK